MQLIRTQTDRSPHRGRPVWSFQAAAAIVAIIGLVSCAANSRTLKSDATLVSLGNPDATAVSVTDRPTGSPVTVVTDSTAVTAITTALTTPITTPIPVTLVSQPTMAPTTAAITAQVDTTSIPTSCVSCDPMFSFPYASFFDVAQLGSEPVRGTGCGADGSLGEEIPDGYWHGQIDVGSAALSIDVICVYYGASAAPYVAACEATDTEGTCLEYGDQFWQINSNTRKRFVPLDESFRRRYALQEGCSDPGPGNGTVGEVGSNLMDSWIVIENGLATFALTSCVYG